MADGAPAVPVAAALSIGSAADLDPPAIAAIAGGHRFSIAPDLLAALGRRRAEVLAALADGRAVYGVNTGMGAQSKVRLSVAEQARHQHDLLLARAVGGAPWLPVTEVRALLAVRIRTFLQADAGVSPALVLVLAELLNRDIHPAVPATGSGSAGEIIPLAHAFGPLVGIGEVLTDTADGTTADGITPGGTTAGTESAAEALRRNGLAHYVLGSKEGVALLQGVPGTTAAAVLLARQAHRLTDRWLDVSALSTVGANAPADVHLPVLARGDAELRAVNERLTTLLAGPSSGPTALQAPVSFRVGGVALAHVRRSLAALEAAAERALIGVTDSPAFLDGGFHATPGFDGLDLAAHLDQLTVALVHAAEVSAARTHRLLDQAVTGLSAQLTARPGPETGLVAVHKRAVAVVHQLRRSSLSSIIGAVETSFGQEDVQTFSWEAAQNVRTVVAGCLEVLACELLTALQAVTLGGRQVGPALQPLLDGARAVVPDIVGDRPFGPDIEALRALLSGPVRISG